jgi:hypothetical protein
MGVGGNSAYGGTRGSFSPPDPTQPWHTDFPLASADWEEYHKPSPRSEPLGKIIFEVVVAVSGCLCIISAVIFPQRWELALVGVLALALLTAFAARERGKLTSD